MIDEHAAACCHTDGNGSGKTSPWRQHPGKAAQPDFTHATELAVTIAGQPFAQRLCVVVLSFSNWP